MSVNLLHKVPLGVPTLLIGELDDIIFDVVRPAWKVYSGDDFNMDLVREIRTLLQRKPWSGEHRLYFSNAEMIPRSVWDVLLKILEELPDFARVAIQTTNVQALPATISSRCFAHYLPVSLQPPSVTKGGTVLMKAVIMGDPRLVFDNIKEVESPADVYSFIDWMMTWCSPEMSDFAHGIRALVRQGARPAYAMASVALRAIPDYRRVAAHG